METLTTSGLELRRNLADQVRAVRMVEAAMREQAKQVNTNGRPALRTRHQPAAHVRFREARKCVTARGGLPESLGGVLTR